MRGVAGRAQTKIMLFNILRLIPNSTWINPQLAIFRNAYITSERFLSENKHMKNTSCAATALHGNDISLDQMTDSEDPSDVLNLS